VNACGTLALTLVPRPEPRHFTLVLSTESLTGTENGLPADRQRVTPQTVTPLLPHRLLPH